MTSSRTGLGAELRIENYLKHDLRYDMADEYVELVCQLWDSWEPDAVVMDRHRHVTRMAQGAQRRLHR